MQICKQCGHENDDQAVFCANPNCGTFLQWTADDEAGRSTRCRSGLMRRDGGAASRNHTCTTRDSGFVRRTDETAAILAVP